MKRTHIHLSTDNLEASLAYYTALFGAEPVKREPDYAKWLLDDPALNFAISTHGGTSGISHLGISVDSNEELDAVAARLRDADAPATEESDATCCYARSDKYWSHDPQGAVWELFRTFGESETYGPGRNPEPKAGQCCAPAAS
ncbi:ArsI/CadI family heavy metal resistance metalloenzyme [Marinicaulis aureus]|uniref:ArsI/CadI family heavy metal resistance metalloenzyme n=1 Tax=Hyphococcus aureus TaxID=2666033 RepID=A0ABW1KVM2_9PROT